MTQPTRSKREEFLHWLAYMDTALGQFLAELPEDVARRLDFSPASLDALEAWLLQTFPSRQAALDRAHAFTLDGSARYIGETFRRNVGGEWDIELDNIEDPFVGIPVVTRFPGRLERICPLVLATGVAGERKGNLLSNFLLYYMTFRPSDA